MAGSRAHGSVAGREGSVSIFLRDARAQKRALIIARKDWAAGANCRAPGQSRPAAAMAEARRPPAEEFQPGAASATARSLPVGPLAAAERGAPAGVGSLLPSPAG